MYIPMKIYIFDILYDESYIQNWKTVNLPLNWIIVHYLNNTTQRALWAFGSMSAQPRGMPPHGLAITTSNDLIPSNNQFQRPHSRHHLPKHETTIFPTSCSQALHVSSSWNLRFATDHLHYSTCIHVFATLLLLQASCCCQILLYDIMCNRGFLQINIICINLIYS